MAKQKKVVISAAITGAIHTPTMSPYFPASPEQIAQQAIDAAKAGARGGAYPRSKRRRHASGRL